MFHKTDSHRLNSTLQCHCGLQLRPRRLYRLQEGKLYLDIISRLYPRIGHAVPTPPGPPSIQHICHRPITLALPGLRTCSAPPIQHICPRPITPQFTVRFFFVFFFSQNRFFQQKQKELFSKCYQKLDFFAVEHKKSDFFF